MLDIKENKDLFKVSIDGRFAFRTRMVKHNFILVNYESF